MKVAAACHIHSNWSYDGVLPLETVAHKFGRHGYRILMMTEHDRGFSDERWANYRQACFHASSDKMLLLPGLEYSDPYNLVHVLVWGDIPFLGESLPTRVLLDAAARANGAAVFAHPSRREAWRCFEPAWADHLLGVELWNRKVDGWSPSRDAALILQHSHVRPFAAMDFHGWRQIFPLAMMFDINDTVTEDSVLSCLRARRCEAYACGIFVYDSLFKRLLPFLRLGEHIRRIISRVERQVRAKRGAPLDRSPAIE